MVSKVLDVPVGDQMFPQLGCWAFETQSGSLIWLVVEVSTHVETYARQIGSFPQVGMKIKHI